MLTVRINVLLVETIRVTVFTHNVYVLDCSWSTAVTV